MIDPLIKEYLERNNIEIPDDLPDDMPDVKPPKYNPHHEDWYDGYDHHIPHHHYHHHHHDHGCPHCPHCPPDREKEKYGFSLEKNGKYYTGGSNSCCPIKVTVTKITANEVEYTDKNGVTHIKSYHDFMTSSWRDKSL